jgi:two-component system response regulator
VHDWLNGNIAEKEQIPHIVLLDLKLPKLDGLAVLRMLRNHADTGEIPVVTYSAEYTQDDVLMSYQVGANSFVPKPVDLVQYTALFRDQLAYWMQAHQREMIFVAGEGERG